MIRRAVKATKCRTPTHTRRDINCTAVQEQSRAVDLWCSVLVSHPTLGEVHKMSSVIMFLRALASSADAYPVVGYRLNLYLTQIN